VNDILICQCRIPAANTMPSRQAGSGVKMKGCASFTANPQGQVGSRTRVRVCVGGGGVRTHFCHEAVNAVRAVATSKAGQRIAVMSVVLIRVNPVCCACPRDESTVSSF
jgi:hypothetical protein